MNLLTQMVLVSLVFLSQVYAVIPNEFGNGGGVVSCPDNVTLLDYYEAEILGSDLVPDLGPIMGGTTSNMNKLQDGIKKAFVAVKRLQRLDSARANRYQQFLNEFRDKARFLSGHHFNKTQDYGVVLPLPEGCEIKTAISFIGKQFHEPTQYLINEDVWRELEVLHVAGLLLHEAIYTEMFELGAKNSLNARAFNRWISSKVFEEATIQDYAKHTKAWFSYIDDPTDSGAGNLIKYAAYTMDVELGQTLSIPLSFFLNKQNAVDVQWRIIGKPLGWLVADVGLKSLVGQVPEGGVSGTYNLLMNVFRGTAILGNISLTLWVKPGALPEEESFSVKNPVNIGEFDQATGFEFDLLKHGNVMNPNSLDLRYRMKAGSAPQWLHVSTQGQVFGQPPAAFSGPFQGVVIVSTSDGREKSLTVYGKIRSLEF